ncbi:MAG: S8 family serine peptidase, partial [Chloroflexi bacterium]|nr:S8 family serine peptidase [Chloroflexota bacterium]
MALFASTLGLAGAGPSPTLAAEGTQLPSVEVSAELRAGLEASPTGRAQAVITTHRYSDLATLRRLGIRGTQLRVLPMLLVKALTPAQLNLLQRSPAVRSVYHNARHQLQMEDSNWIIGSRYVWGPPHAPTRFGTGYTGKGVDVAVIDTGIDGEHSDTDNLVEFCDTTAAASGDRSEVICAGGNNRSDSAAARSAAFDDEGHGSHVSGTVGGTGDASGGRANNHSTIGVAPEVDLHVYSANIGPFLANFQILAAYDDMTFKKLNENSRVVATSNSFGGGDGANYSPDDPQNVAIKAAYDANIISVYAAGNSGPEHNTLSDSCINPYVVCVGATTKPDSVVQFSSRGRPSEPADTNRNGIVGDDGSNGTTTTADDISEDVAPDNHDRLLGQRLGIGLYRPTLVAPGVNIFSISAFLGEGAVGPCSETSPAKTGCYEPLNGTSMATPHVSGAIGVIVQAYRATHGGATPNAARIIDILERSAALHKLPGYEAEEQGAGRLNVLDAVRYARGEVTLPKPNYGTPSPVYASGKDPRSTFTSSRLAANVRNGCAGALSFTAGSSNPLDEPADQPPDATARFGQKLIDVPQGAERLRITVRWPQHEGANLYIRLWRPGVNPNAEFSSEFDKRAFPDQEAIGLVDTEAILNQQRFLDVRAPEAGTWRVRIYHRIGGAPLACDVPDSSEQLGYRYQLLTEIPVSARVPTVAITSPAAGSTHTGRYVFFRGTAGYPTRWDGVTNYEVPGTGIAAGGLAADPRVVLRFHGNTEEGCTGDGSVDLDTASCNGGNGPSLLSKTTLSSSPAASYTVLNPVLGGNTERNSFVPNWIWDISTETTLRGPMTVQWWGSCSACGPTTGSADWTIRLYADGVQQFQKRITATPSGPEETTLLSTTVDLPTIKATDRFVLHIDPVYIDSQNNSKIYYDSSDPCPNVPAESPQAACQSLVRMPVFDSGSVAPAENVRVTDIHT